MTRRAATALIALPALAALVAAPAAMAQPAPTTCGTAGVPAASGVSTDTYIGRPGMTKPSWLRGQTLVVERFTGGPGRAGGTLAFVAERTTFVPPGSVVTEQAPAPGRAGTFRYTGEYALAGVPSGPVPPAGGLPELSPGRTLVTPDIGPLCIATTTPVAGGAVITATRMGLQDAFLAGRFAPLRSVPAPANGGQKSAAARESSVGASLRVLERRNSSGTLLGYVDLGTEFDISDAVLDFGWSWSRGSWGKVGFSTTFQSSVTAKVLSRQGLDSSDSKSISGIVGGGAFGPIPFTVRLGATAAGRLKSPGRATMVSTRTKRIPLIVRCQTRRLDSGRFCQRLSGSGSDPSGISWTLSYDTGGDVTLRGTLTPTLSMLVADLVGPFVGVTSGAEYEVNATDSGRFISSDGEAFITAKAGGELRFLGWVKRFSFDIWSKTWDY